MEIKTENYYTHITFVCIETTGTDRYNEDENGQEYHSIEKITKLVMHTVSTEKANKFYNNYLECNADNPQYDTYNITHAFWSHNNELISLRQFENNEVQ